MERASGISHRCPFYFWTVTKLRPVFALLLLFAVLGPPEASAAGPYVGMHPDGSIAMYVDSTGSNGENERLVGSSLAVFLGIFGAHRIYLGTSPKVAVVYGLTFGGFGVLVLLDLGHLIFSKDLAPYRNNERVIMWGSPKEQLTPQ